MTLTLTSNIVILTYSTFLKYFVFWNSLAYTFTVVERSVGIVSCMNVILKWGFLTLNTWYSWLHECHIINL